MSLLTNIAEIKWMPVRKRVVNESPFTGRRQHSTLRFHRWEFLVQYTKTRGAAATAKIAALHALQGGDVHFNFTDPTFSEPASGYSGSGAVNGDSTGYTLTADGFTPSTSILKAGDLLSIEIDSRWQLFTSASDVTSNGDGEITVTLNQPIRGTAPDGATVKISDWLISVTLEKDETYSTDKNGLLVLPAMKYVEDY